MPQNTDTKTSNMENFKALWLVKEGDKVILKMEVSKGNWVTLIEEYTIAPFSHIIEPIGIEERMKHHTLKPQRNKESRTTQIT